MITASLGGRVGSEADAEEGVDGAGDDAGSSLVVPPATSAAAAQRSTTRQRAGRVEVVGQVAAQASSRVASAVGTAGPGHRGPPPGEPRLGRRAGRPRSSSQSAR